MRKMNYNTIIPWRGKSSYSDERYSFGVEEKVSCFRCDEADEAKWYSHSMLSADSGFRNSVVDPSF
jgi:hypothetical protein